MALRTMTDLQPTSNPGPPLTASGVCPAISVNVNDRVLKDTFVFRYTWSCAENVSVCVTVRRATRAGRSYRLQMRRTPSAPSTMPDTLVRRGAWH